MPRKARIVIPDCAHHVTQRGNNRQDVFFVDSDRKVYLEYLRDASERFDLNLDGYCLMTNHVHLVLRPHHETSLAEALKRINQLYAQYINRMHRRSGHLWQNRFFSCPLGENHFWRTLAYIERNPVRARLTRKAWRWRWSSAAAHCGIVKHSDFIDIPSWKRDVGFSRWKKVLDLPDDEKLASRLRLSTSRGRPLGTDAFIAKMETLLGRRLRPMPRGRPAKKLANIKGKKI
ncbi:MAG: transposase [Sedimentisphaerales bacterium]|nr:transposase [Sedimentisphaerales bacterium]